MAIRLITPPAAEPVTLAQAKSHLRVDHTNDDALISSLIVASRGYCENFTARAFITQTWELVIDEFPANEIMIPLPPLQSVVSISYDDPAALETVISSSSYAVDTVSQPGWVLPPANVGWPSTFDSINTVRIRFIAGYAPGTTSPVDLAENVPQSIKAAILLYVGQLYENRENVIVGAVINTMPSGSVEHLLRQYRVDLGMA